MCFSAFLLFGLTTAVTGNILIWFNEGWGLDDVLGKTFISSFLFTVLFGLFVSGIRSMIGVSKNGEDG